MTAILKREFRSHFQGLDGYISLAILVVFSGFLVIYYGFLCQMPTLSYVLSDLMPIAALVCPFLVYKSAISERAGGADRLLRSLPLSSIDIALGRYLSILLIYAIETVVLALVPLVYNYFGEVNFAASYTSLLAFFVFCASIISVCLFFSLRIRKPLWSLIAGIGYAVLMYILQAVSFFVEKQGAVGEIFGGILSFVGIFNRFELFVYGVLDVGAIVYYLSIAFFFLFLSWRTLEKRRSGGAV